MDSHVPIFANKSITLLVAAHYIGTAREGFVRPISDPVEWTLNPVIQSNTYLGYYLQHPGGSYMTYEDSASNDALSLTSDVKKAAQVYLKPNWEEDTFTILLTSVVTPQKKALTVDMRVNGTYFQNELFNSKWPLFQNFILSASGLTDSSTITEELVRYTLELYNLQLSDGDIRELVSKFSTWSYSYLKSLNHDDLERQRRSMRGATIGAIVGGILGGFLGFCVQGPWGAVIGASAGATLGMGIGLMQEPSGIDDIEVAPPEDKVLQLAQGNDEVMRSYITISPAGGPYTNNSAITDYLFYLDFPMIGDETLPLAGVVLPPSPGSQKLRTWLPSSNSIITYPVDETNCPPLNNFQGGRKIYMQLFVIVKVPMSSGDKYQLRIYPKAQNNGTDPNRTLHSQITNGNRFSALLTTKSSREHMTTYGAGELYLMADDGGDKAGQLIGIEPETGHYYKLPRENFATEVFTTTSMALQALGYDTSDLQMGQDLANIIYGWSHLNM